MQSVLRSKILPSPLGYNNYFSRKPTPGIVRFQKSAASGTNRPESDGGETMDHQTTGKKEKGIRGDMMSSYGEGYATRSDEEGFGGIYGGNQDEHENEKDKDKDIHEFDKQQGSEVKEKEKSRHQKDANA